jgi:indolepyruvate ferredoxin oxidoreductase beta subunit
MSPLIPKGYADVIIGFEPAEAARNIDYLKPDGMLVVSNRAIQPSAGKPYDTAAVLGFLQDNTRVKIVDADEVFRATGSYRSLNIALLGVASRWGAIPFDVRELEAAMRGLMSERAVAASIPALTLGTESGSAGTV